MNFFWLFAQFTFLSSKALLRFVSFLWMVVSHAIALACLFSKLSLFILVKLVFFRSSDLVVLYSKFCEAPLRLYVINLYYYPIDKLGMFMEELTCV